MINIFRKMKQKSKDRIFSEYPCADFLHNALHFLARNKPEVTYGEICYALLKSGNKLTDEEPGSFVFAQAIIIRKGFFRNER